MALCCRFACSLLDVRLTGRSLSLPNGYKFLGLVSADGLLQSHLFKSCSTEPIQSATAACRARSHQLSGRLLAATDVLMTGGQAIQNNGAGCHTDARSGAARLFRASPEGVAEVAYEDDRAHDRVLPQRYRLSANFEVTTGYPPSADSPANLEHPETDCGFYHDTLRSCGFTELQRRFRRRGRHCIVFIPLSGSYKAAAHFKAADGARRTTP